MDYQALVYSLSDRVGVVRLNRPEKMNSLNPQLLDELAAIAAAVDHDPEVSVLVITGTEKYFCAGADIGELAKIASPEGGFQFTRRFHHTFQRLGNLSIPVIAALSGYVLGGGFELAINCDLRYASESAVLGLPEVDLGVLPAATGTQKLPRLVGLGAGLELLLTGKRIDAKEALRIGLVNGVFPKETYMEEIMSIARAMAQKPRAALTANKRLATRGIDMPFEAASVYESTQFAAMCQTPDFQERIHRFLKR